MIEGCVRQFGNLVYKNLYRRLTDQTPDREDVHIKAVAFARKYTEDNKLLLEILSRSTTYKNPVLHQEIFGLQFPHPFMIAAGLDKNGLMYKSLAALGFHPEIGTVTRWPYPGETRPRMFLLEDDQGMINRMRYPSEGVDEISKRLMTKYIPRPERKYNLFINIGANKPSFDSDTPIQDMIYVLGKVYEPGDGFVFGISPNTPQTLGLLEPENLSELLLRAENIRKSKKQHKPLLLKLPPDLPLGAVDNILDTALSHNIDGFVLTNTTLDPKIKEIISGRYKDEEGGYSGKYLRRKSSKLTRYIYKRTEGKIPLVACGGLGRHQIDLWEALTFDGASAFQFFTYFVHPQTSTLNFSYNLGKRLSQELKNRGFANIKEAIGAYAD